jgi:hypothetical protein
MMVARVWRRAGLKPHRIERYMASDDPDFELKAADIIGLYVKPPQHAAVLCVDEKTAIQALDRLDPVLPLSPGRLERHGFEYYRHGTLSLYAALNTKRRRGDGQNCRASDQPGVRGLPHRPGRQPAALNGVLWLPGPMDRAESGCSSHRAAKTGIRTRGCPRSKLRVS